MRLVRNAAVIVSIVGPSGCGDDLAPAAGADGSGATSQDANVGATSGGDSDPGQRDTGSDSAGDTTGSSEGSTTAAGPDIGAEMILQRDGPEGRFWFRFRIVDGVVGSPELMHEQSPHSWESATVFPDRRVVYRVVSNAVSELRLGSTADPLNAATVALDVPPASPGADPWPIAIPGQDAVLYGNDATLWRVDLEGFSGTPPVALSAYEGVSLTQAVSVGPDGGHATVDLPPDEDGTRQLALVSLTEDPTPQTLATVLPGGRVSMRGWSAGGDAAFLHASTTMGGQSLYIDLSGATPAAPVLVSDSAWVDNEYSIRPHAQAYGALHAVGNDSFSDELAYIGVDEGEALSPVLLHDPATTTASPGSRAWSPDGRWLQVWTREHEDDDVELFLASFGDGHTPISTSVATYADSPYATPGSSLWAPDSTALYRTEGDGGGGLQLWKWMLAQDGSSEPALLIESDDAIHLGAFSPNGETLLYTDGPDLIALDVGGDGSGEPHAVNAPVDEGARAANGVFSPDGRFIAYVVRDADILDPYAALRLWLTDAAQPGIAFEIASDVRWFEFVDGWD